MKVIDRALIAATLGIDNASAWVAQAPAEWRTNGEPNELALVAAEMTFELVWRLRADTLITEALVQLVPRLPELWAGTKAGKQYDITARGPVADIALLFLARALDQYQQLAQ